MAFWRELTEQQRAESDEALPLNVGLRFRAKRLEDEVREYDVPMNPKCYRLDLQVQAFEQTIREATSQAYDGRWKNSQGMTGYLTLYSSDEQVLQNAIREIATSSTGLRRFFT